MTDQTQAAPMSVGRVAAFLLSTRRALAFALIVVSLIAGLSEALTITLVVKAIGQLMAGTKAPTSLGPFVLGVTSMLVISTVAAVLRLGTSIWAAQLGPRLSAHIRQDLRLRLVRAYANADWSVQVRDRSGEFAEVTTAQVDETGAIVLGGTQAIVAASTLVALLATSVAINPVATLVLLVAGFALFAVARPITRRAYRGIQQNVDSRGDVASDIDSMCACTEEMQVYGVADHFCDRISRSVETSERSFYRGQMHGRVAGAIFQSATLLIIVGGAWVLAQASSSTDAGALGAVVILLMRGAGLAQQVQNFTALLNTQRPYVERVARELERYESSWQTPHPSAGLDSGRHPLVLQDVSFTYPDSATPALSSTTLSIGPGGAVGVKGPSGAGKSTLVQLLLGLRRPTTGTLRYGGIEVVDLGARERSKVIALVGQVPKLLPGTIRENIDFFRGLSEQDIHEAARRAAVLDDILNLPDGFDTVVGQRVDPVSGGQRQRICIARALAASPAVLVLDEPTSSLDSESERVVVHTLAELAKTMTVVVVSHRTAPLSICNTVLTIENGAVATSTGPAAPGDVPPSVPTSPAAVSVPSMPPVPPTQPIPRLSDAAPPPSPRHAMPSDDASRGVRWWAASRP